ncbi:MAG: capsule assembly Wzi family protein [Spirochaetales bacterium]|nr:capsule assembly Wzi family protein [Spirochaetales bacterium]
MNQLKLSIISAVLLLLVNLSLSAQWDQELIPLDDELYELTELLYEEAGLIIPTLARPWTRAELNNLLDRLPADKLSLPSLQLMGELSQLNNPEPSKEWEGFAFRMDMALSLEYFDHEILYSEGDVPDLYPVEYATQDHQNLLEIPFHISYFDNLYMESRINLRETPVLDLENEDNYTNLPSEAYDMDFMFPQRAYVSYGGEQWNVALGRFAEDWGNGRTGNMFLSPNSDYIDHFRFAALMDKFTFTYIFASLESRVGVEDIDTDGDGEIDSSGVSYDSGGWSGSKSLVAHRFEFNPSKRLRISFVEGLIMGGEDFQLTLYHFNPMMLYHNWFTGNYGNSYHSLEVDYTIPNYRFYTQICLDQYQSVAESLMYPDNADEPAAYGFMAGYESTHRAKSGYFHSGFEFVYTSPYLYTYDDYYNRPTNGQFYSADTSYIIETPLGYSEGPDTIVFSLYGAYEVPREWSLTGEVRYTISGENTIETVYPFGNDDADLDNLTPTGDAEYEWKFALDGEKTLSEQLSVGAGVALYLKDNPEALFMSDDDETYSGTLDSVEWNCFMSYSL